MNNVTVSMLTLTVSFSGGAWPVHGLYGFTARPIGPWPIRSLELSLPGAKWPRNFRSLLGTSLLGTFIPCYVNDTDLRHSPRLYSVLYLYSNDILLLL